MRRGVTRSRSCGGGCVRRSPACIAGRRISISCAAIWMPSSRHLQPARQSFYSMSVSDSGLFIQRPSALSETGQAPRAGSTRRPLGIGKSDGHASPAGASMRSGRASARSTPGNGRCRIASLADRNSFRSSREARCSQEHSTLPDRFNLCENCYKFSISIT